MRGVRKLIAVLCLMAIAIPDVGLAEKKTRKQQEQDCDVAYETCAKAADDWFASVDQSDGQNIDDYGLMLNGCRIRQKWCKQDIKRSTRVGIHDANVPPQGGVVEPEPPKKGQPAGRPATGGVSPNK
ncbi:MAG: hypothetical protein K8S25_10445 [Alphaproteobacteria bacterium]|nr:hypothetical protein [Alphaproteobacteria bacterium]